MGETKEKKPRGQSGLLKEVQEIAKQLKTKDVTLKHTEAVRQAWVIMKEREAGRK